MQKAIGMLECISLARGILVADQMVKVADVEIVTAGSVCPGKYIVIVHGDVAAVETAVETGEQFAAEHLADSILIPNVNPSVFPALTCSVYPEQMQALGIIESFSLASMLLAADAILKSADLEPIELRMGNGIGGKAFFTFTGEVSAVETGISAGKKVIAGKGLLVNAEVIPSPSERVIPSLF